MDFPLASWRGFSSWLCQIDLFSDTENGSKINSPEAGVYFSPPAVDFSSLAVDFCLLAVDFSPVPKHRIL